MQAQLASSAAMYARNLPESCFGPVEVSADRTANEPLTRVGLDSGPGSDTSSGGASGRRRGAARQYALQIILPLREIVGLSRPAQEQNLTKQEQEAGLRQANESGNVGVPYPQGKEFQRSGPCGRRLEMPWWLRRAFVRQGTWHSRTELPRPTPSSYSPRTKGNSAA